MSLPPSELDAVQLTRAAPEEGSADTPVGAVGAIGASTVTAPDGLDRAPLPFGLEACTRNV